MMAALEASQESTVGLLDVTEALSVELAANAHRSALVASFLEQYQLAPSEAAVLREGEVGSDAFQAALSRVTTIHENCRQLLRRHHQRAGLELMDAMAVHQEAAYERLCRWVQTQCAALGEQEPGAPSAEISPQLARGMALLAARPLLQRHAAEEAAGVLQQALFGRFIAALTRGGPGGVPRPMEVHAHDPRRYVGDMCAWLHQSCASERELVQTLLGGTPPPEAAADDALPPVTVPWALDRVFEGVCRPFRVRVESSLAGLPPSALLLAFQLASLLGFYASTLEGLVGATSALTRTVVDCHDAALRVLFTQLAARRERLVRHPLLPDAGTVPPAPFTEAALRATEMLEAARDGGMGAADEKEQDGASTAAVISALIDPLVEAAQRGAATLPPHEGGAYFVNCMACLLAPLLEHPATSVRASELQAVADAALSTFVTAETSLFLSACGLSPFLALVESGAVAPGPALAPAAVGPALDSFYARLTASVAPLPDISLLQLPRDRSAATRRIAAALADAYDSVFSAVSRLHSSAALRHEAAEVRLICEGL